MEQWKEIPGYEGLYEASNLGRIRTVSGKTTSNSRYEKRVWKRQLILKPKYEHRKSGNNCDGRVSLWKNSVVKTVLVARLIAMTWCDGYQEGMTVNHKDCNPLNNKADNLEWISLSENINHAYDNVLFSSQKPCVLIGKTGEEKWFRSQIRASIWLGRSKGYIHECIKKHRAVRSSDGETYEIKAVVI